MALAGDRPIPFQPFHPGFEALTHEFGAPGYLPPFGEDLLLEVQCLDEPLRRHDDFKRGAGALGNGHHLARRHLAAHDAALGEHLQDGGARLIGGKAFQRVHGGLGAVDIRAWPIGCADGKVGAEAARIINDDAQRQLVGAPPVNVHHVAEGAAHHYARALFGVGVLVGNDRH